MVFRTTPFIACYLQSTSWVAEVPMARVQEVTKRCGSHVTDTQTTERFSEIGLYFTAFSLRMGQILWL